MLIVADFVGKSRVPGLYRKNDFIVSHGIDNQQFLISPNRDQSIQHIFTVYYRPSSEVGDLTALVSVAQSNVAARMPLLDATLVLCLIAADPCYRDRVLSAIPDDIESALMHFGIATDRLRPAVQPAAEGMSIAPEGEGFTVFLTEHNGAMSRLAHGDARGAAFAFGYFQRGEEVDILGQTLRFEHDRSTAA